MVHRSYPDGITDPAPPRLTQLKMQSFFVNNYDFAVNSDVWICSRLRRYCWKIIADSNLRPFDDFLRDDFLQGVSKVLMSPPKTMTMHLALGDGMMNLSRLDILGSKGSRTLGV